MKRDLFGQVFITSEDLCDLLYQDPAQDLSKFRVTDAYKYNRSVKAFHLDFPILKSYDNFFSEKELKIEEFDQKNQSNWYMPEEYVLLDIEKYCIDLCKDSIERQRVSEEFALYKEQNALMLLRYLKYLVDTMRKNNIVWGVGRGSSVASYVLYLIGVHKINSIKFDLDIKEFLK